MGKKEAQNNFPPKIKYKKVLDYTKVLLMFCITPCIFVKVFAQNVVTITFQLVLQDQMSKRFQCRVFSSNTFPSTSGSYLQ